MWTFAPFSIDGGDEHEKFNWLYEITEQIKMFRQLLEASLEELTVTHIFITKSFNSTM